MSAGWSTANLFQILQVSPILGRTFSEAEDAPKSDAKVVVISEGLWKSRFGGSHDALGKRIVINGRSLEVIGVMSASFRFPTVDTRLWLTENIDPSDPEQGGFNHDAVTRLKPGVTVEAAQRDRASVLPRIVELYPTFAPGIATKMVMDQARPTPSLIPMRDDVVGDVSKTLWMVAATAVLVLIVTCANVANLLLVRADGRYRELSVRAALGAGQRRIVAYFLTESALLAGISAVLGLVVATIAVHLLVRAGPEEIPRLAEVGVDAPVVIFTIVVAFLVALACSAIPAVRFLRADVLGVRIALGAQPSAVAPMVTKQGLALSGTGVVIGLALVLLMARFIRSLLFEVAPTDAVTLGGASGLLLFFVALVASWIPARRAARVNPTEALRAD